MHRVSLFFIFFVLVGCSRKAAPSIVYQDVITTKYDTITDFSFSGYDTIYSHTPCDSFIRVIKNNDTVYIKEVKVKVVTKLVTKVDTVFRTPIINNPQPKKVDNSVKVKVTKGGIIGDGNTQTNNYDFWKGFFTCFLIFVAYFALRRTIKTYFPFLKFLP